MSLKTIKSKIRSVDKTHKVTKAMEAVSAVKMRKSQEWALQARPYAYSALNILHRVSESGTLDNTPLRAKRDAKISCFLVVTSDKGLAGNLNNAILKKVQAHIEERGLTKENTKFICIGKKGSEFFKKRGFNVIESYDNINDDVSTDDMKEITNKLIKMFEDSDIDRCDVFYTHFISTFEQKAVMRRLLPISYGAVEDVIEGIVPKIGKFSDEKDNTKTQPYMLEPDSDEIFKELLPFLINIQVFHSLIEAKASEHSARMVAMKNASDKAEEISKELNLKFNKARQALITREVSEIIGGMESLEK